VKDKLINFLLWGAIVISVLLLAAIKPAKADIITVPIPGAPGLNVTVGTGVNALPLTEIKNNPQAVNVTMGDDSNVNIPLGFTFPFFGQSFTNSWMYSNGGVSFKGPDVPGGFCCAGENLNTLRNPAYNYSIVPLWTDLIAYQGGSHYYLREANALTYGWYGVSQYGNINNRNSFEVKIDASGLVDTRIAGALVTGSPVTSGMIGDISKGEFYQFYHGSGININQGGSVSWQALGGTGGGNPCIVNPLFDASCPGYAEAYLAQQCTLTALFSSSCPGYGAAYYIQQCSLNALYDTGCPGYTQAYYNQQCSTDPLYDTGCPGYNQAYYNHQCSLNPLYDTGCPGYELAYYNQQCSLNPLYHTGCPGYSTAYFNHQCALNPLYNSGCPGYTQAYYNQQCSLNTLYDSKCPGYEQAYFNQQCNLNGLYDRTCPKYAEEYAKQHIINTPKPETASTTAVSTSSNSPSSVALVPDAVVNQTITSTATTAAPTGAAPAAPVNLTAQPQSTQMQSPMEQGQPGKQESKPESKSEPKSETKTESKPESPKMASARAAAKESAQKSNAEKGSQAAANMGQAKSMNEQINNQGIVIGAMGFVPGFDAYLNNTLKDIQFYKKVEVYKNQNNVDNIRLLRGLSGGSDRLHEKMIDSQYSLKGN
jgi:hypothetical protein